MAKRILVSLLAAACLLLAGCRQSDPPAPEEPPAPPSAVPIPPAGESVQAEPQPVFLDRLTIEVVEDWSETDRILSQLDALSQLAGEALAEKDCTVEAPVVVTIGTAGGITAQALRDGGVDAAILPTGDYAEIEAEAAPVLHSSDETVVTAVTLAREELDENFQAILAAALLETDAGKDFLEICYPGVKFTKMDTRIFYVNS